MYSCHSDKRPFGVICRRKRRQTSGAEINIYASTFTPLSWIRVACEATRRVCVATPEVRRGALLSGTAAATPLKRCPPWLPPTPKRNHPSREVLSTPTLRQRGAHSPAMFAAVHRTPCPRRSSHVMPASYGNIRVRVYRLAGAWFQRTSTPRRGVLKRGWGNAAACCLSHVRVEVYASSTSVRWILSRYTGGNRRRRVLFAAAFVARRSARPPTAITLASALTSHAYPQSRGEYAKPRLGDGSSAVAVASAARDDVPASRRY